MFFGLIYFWIFELFFIAFFYLKLFKIEMHRHQYFAFIVNIISIILTFVKIFLTIAEKDEKKAIYVKYWSLIFILILFHLIYSISMSYALVQLKNIFYLGFIPVTHITLIYGIFGLILCTTLSIIFTYNPCGNYNKNNYEIKDYICKVINNNQTFFDNFNIYFSEAWKNSENFDKRNEIITCTFKYSFFAIHKYYEMKIVESLTPFHRIISNAVYYCTDIIFILCFNFIRIINDNKYILKPN